MRYNISKRCVTRVIAAFACALMAPFSVASMVLSNVIVHFEPGAPARQDIDIQNSGEEPLYIEIKPHMIHAAGSVDERRELIRNPREAGLLVTPNRLVIAPGARKRLRIVNLRPGDTQERVYRIAVTPVVGELDAQQSGLKVLIGYEVLVLAQPVEPKPELIAERIDRTLHFENRGNTNVLLREGHQCESDAVPLEACEALASKRLYPGNRWQVALPFDRPAQYQLGIGTEHAVKVYP